MPRSPHLRLPLAGARLLRRTVTSAPHKVVTDYRWTRGPDAELQIGYGQRNLAFLIPLGWPYSERSCTLVTANRPAQCLELYSSENLAS